MLDGIPKLLGEGLALLNRLTGNYQSRVKDGLLGTGDDLVNMLCNKKIKDPKRKKLTKHFCKQWQANREKIR